MNEYPKLLVNKGKHGDEYILVTDKAQEALAWLAMFLSMDKWTPYYDVEGMESDELDAYEGAKHGDAKAAEWF